MKVFVAPELAKPTSLENSMPIEMVSFESKHDEITRQVQCSSEMNMYMSRSHLECEERYKQLTVAVSEMEQKFNKRIKELETHLEAYKSELERANKQIMQSNNECRSHCHVLIPKQTICYCYAQVGAHSHYIAENYNIQ